MQSRSVVVVDYQIGNVFSVCNAFKAVGVEPILTGDPDVVARAERLVLPGVGAFARAMEELTARGLDAAALSFIKTGRPFLGICVGMQMLMEKSTEFGMTPGLGLIEGDVVRIPDTTATGEKHAVPHISWGALELPQNGIGEGDWASSPLRELQPGRSSAYFVHSYMCQPANAADVLAAVSYNGRDLTAAVRKDNVFGVQFHPERSSIAGQKMFRSFMAI